LLKRYAGDLPNSAVRKEMLQRGLIEKTGDGLLRVQQCDYTCTNLDPEIIRRMSEALHDHAATLDHKLNEARKSAPGFEGVADKVLSTRTMM
jgi:hypothetical protein